MADYSVWALGESQISISGGGQLDGVTQGDGSHLEGLTITLNSYDFVELLIEDRGSDANFDDNDGNQRLLGAQSFDGTTYGDNTRIEAEYRITLRDPDTGIEYDALAVNFNNSSPAYGTVEGLAFVDEIPPAGVALEVLQAYEGPGSSGQAAIDHVDIAVPACFTPGTRIATPEGECRVEHLRAGARVLTRDHGVQPLVWVGQTRFGATQLARLPHARPVLIRKNAIAPGVPCRDMRVSPQHRILLTGPRAELLFGEPEVLAAAQHLIDGSQIVVDDAARQTIYIHLKCAAHEVLLSDNLSSESYNPGLLSLGGFSLAAQRRLDQAVSASPKPDDLGQVAARPVIKRHEAALWRRAA